MATARPKVTGEDVVIEEPAKVINHADRHHYINGGSSIKRRMLCPGSAEIEKQMPESTSEDATYGTFIHEGIEEAVKQSVKNKNKSQFILSPLYKPNDLLLVEKAVDNIWSIVGDKWDKIGWACESKFILDHDLELGGTADFCYAYKQSDGKRVGGIWDYKNGIIETDIIQCILYLVAMDTQLGGFDVLRGHIYQPNGLDDTKHIKFIELEPKDVVHYRKLFIHTAKVALGFNGREVMQLVPGEEQCRFCRGTPRCPAVREKAKELTEAIILRGAKTLPDPNELPKLITEEQVLKWLTNSEYIKQVDKAMWKYAHERFNAGTPIKGTKAVYGRSQRSWVKGDESKIAESLQLLGVSDPYDRSLRGITSVSDEIKLHKKATKKEVDVMLAGLTVKSVPGITIVLDNEANAGKEEAQTPTNKVLDLITSETIENDKEKDGKKD